MREELINDSLSQAIEKFEQVYQTTVLMAALGGSRAIGLHNQSSSDYDIIAVAKNLHENKTLYAYDSKIDISCCSEQHVLEELRLWEMQTHIYPTCLHLNKSVQNNHYQGHGIKEDYARTILMKITSSPAILRDSYLKTDRENVARGLMAIDALDYYFTRVNGNYCINLCKERVAVRKYLYTLYGIYAMKWILKYQSKPGCFIELFEKYEEITPLGQRIHNLFEMNLNGKSKEMVKIDPDLELNEYIRNNIEDLKIGIEAFVVDNIKKTINVVKM